MDINQRFNLLIDKVATSRSEFSKRTGLSTVILSHISSGRNKVSLKAVECMLEAYPMINPDYLITGKGPQFKDSNSFPKEELLNELFVLSKDLDQQYKLNKQRILSLIDHINAL